MYYLYLYIYREIINISSIKIYVVYQSPLSVEFFRKNYWSGLPFSSPGDLPNPGIQLRSLAVQADSLPCEPPGCPKVLCVCVHVCVCVCNITEYNTVASIAFQLMIDSLTCYGTSFFLSYIIVGCLYICSAIDLKFFGWNLP